MTKSVEKLGRWRLLHKWLDASSRYADKLAFPASKHYFNNVFLSPWLGKSKYVNSLKKTSGKSGE